MSADLTDAQRAAIAALPADSPLRELLPTLPEQTFEERLTSIVLDGSVRNWYGDNKAATRFIVEKILTAFPFASAGPDGYALAKAVVAWLEPFESEPEGLRWPGAGLLASARALIVKVEGRDNG